MISSIQVRNMIKGTNKYLETNIDPFGSFEDYIRQQEKKDLLLNNLIYIFKTMQMKSYYDVVTYVGITTNEHNNNIVKTIELQIKEFDEALNRSLWRKQNDYPY